MSVKIGKNCQKIANFDIFGDFGGPKGPYRRQICQKMVTGYKM